MWLILANGNAYTLGADYTVTLGSTSPAHPLPAREPGGVQVRVLVDDGRPAGGVRVGIGTTAGLADADGWLQLDGVTAGEQLIKIGPKGDVVTAPITVWGDGKLQTYVVTLIPGQYARAH